MDAKYAPGLTVAALASLLGLTVALAMGPRAALAASAGAFVESDLEARREKAEKFIHLLQEDEFRAAVGLFAPTLLAALPQAELERFWGIFEHRCGSFHEAISYAQRDFPNGQLIEVRGRWERAVMLIRLAFDDQNRIAGFWLARDREGPTPESFLRGGYMFGTATERITGLDHAIAVRVLDADGTPFEKVTVTLWKQLQGEPNERQVIWDDPETQIRWIRCKDGDTILNKQDEFRNGWRRLPTGVYRVTATHAHMSNDPRWGAGPAVRLDGARKTAETTVQLPDGPLLVVRVVDARSGEPIDKAGVRVQSKERRLPYMGWAGLQAIDGAYQRDCLPPGPYALRVSKSSYHPTEPKYVADEEEIDVRIVAGKDHEITVKLNRVSLTQEEIDTRWPWIAEGRVTDAEGNPLAGVAIWAVVGSGGTIFPSGRATSDARGQYTLRYARGGFRLTNPPGNPPLRLQTGGIHASKDGYVEKNLDRHASVIVADRMPKDEDWRNYNIPRDHERVVLPGKPRRIDFVMVPKTAIPEP